MDSERLKTPKQTVCYKFTKTKNSISLDSRFVDLENIGERATLTPEDDLQWWKMEAKRLPILATLAQKYLSVCGTSVPSEQLFILLVFYELVY